MVRAPARFRRYFLQQQGAEAFNRAQRRAQVMRHGIRKRLQRHVRRFQLGGSALHPAFQFAIEHADVQPGAPALGDVGDGADVARRGAACVLKQRLQVNQCPPFAVVRPAVADHHVRLPQPGAPGDGTGPGFLQHWRAVVVQDLPVRHGGGQPPHLVQRPAGKALGAGIAVNDSPLGVAQHHPFSQCRHHRAEASLAGPQRRVNLRLPVALRVLKRVDGQPEFSRFRAGG